MATVGSVAVLAGFGAAPALAAETCANAALRTGASANLPDCRAYELVSPADKDQYAVGANAAGTFPSTSGDQARFGGAMPFDDPQSGKSVVHVADRGATGWTSRNLIPAFCGADQSGIVGGVAVPGLSNDFATAILQYPANNNCPTGDEAGNDVYRLGRSGAATWVSQNADGSPRTSDVSRTYVGSNADASHILFSTSEKLVVPLEDGRTTGLALYDRTGGRTVPVGLKSDGSLINACGARIAGNRRTVGAVSDDGRVIFFTSGSSSSVAGCSPTTDDGGQLYARIDASRTVMISGSQLVTPEARVAPKFLGATPDGRRVFFSSTERLSDKATAGGGLYEYDLTNVLSGAATTGQLRFLSPSVDGSPASVQGLLGVSDGGSRVYFLAYGTLDAAVPAGSTGGKVYVAQGGDVSYVTDGLSAVGLESKVSVSADGSKLVVVRKPSGSSVDQVDLYDADAPGAGLRCVSCDPDGTTPTGDAKLFGIPGAQSGRDPANGPSRYVTNDGRVFFNSPDQLADRDTNDKYDVYEYDRGVHKLISSGTDPDDAMLVGVAAQGRDVFFLTNASLVPQDIDISDMDLYDARTGGGFAAPIAPSSCTGADGCRTPAATPWLAPVGSVGFVGAGNVQAPPVPPTQKARKVSVKRPKTVRGKTKVRLSVQAPEAGRIRVSGSGLRRAKKTAKQAKTYRVTVKLSKRSKRILRRKHRVKVRATVRFTPKHGKRSRVRVHVTFKTKRHHGKAKRRAHGHAHGSAGKGGR